MKIFVDIDNPGIKNIVERFFNDDEKNGLFLTNKYEEAQIILTDKIKNYININQEDFILSVSEISIKKPIIIGVSNHFDEVKKFEEYNLPFLYFDLENSEKTLANLKSVLQIIRKSLQNQNEKLKKLLDKFFDTELQIQSISKMRMDTIEEIVIRIAISIESKDYYSSYHVKRVANYCKIIADCLGFDSKSIEKIYLASYLHDIGKITVPDSVLLKPGGLTKEEFEIIKKHTTNGAQILANSNNEIIKTAEIIALYHHEKYDGSGYPFGIRGEEIPIEGKIVAIADVFDSITSRRPYREPRTIEEAIYEIKRSVNFHFCPEVVNAFFKSIKKIIEVRHALV
ncbi:MAG: HD-GYP domain-containing protein [bacterium]